mmetsp:Transcript_71895/g.126694  ORF Transcript_71895/g.126694 Transcript_71895/m.126694 type:complete len:226 (-) Transcript_71895:413-1090(-)
MTLLHFINCALLTFGPIWVISKSHEDARDMSKNLKYSAISHMLAQLVKGILLATFAFSYKAGGTIDYGQESFKFLFSFIDAVALLYVLNSARIVGERKPRVCSVGLGWALGDNILTRLAPLWMGQKTLDFSWGQLQLATEANIALATHIALTAVMSMWKRPTKALSNPPMEPMLCALVAARSLIPIVLSVAQAMYGIESWYALGLHAAIASIYCVAVNMRFVASK